MFFVRAMVVMLLCWVVVFFFLLFSIKLNTLLNNNASPQQAGHGMIGNKSSIYTILRILVGLFEFTGKVESGITRQFRFVGRLTSSECCCLLEQGHTNSYALLLLEFAEEHHMKAAQKISYLSHSR